MSLGVKILLSTLWPISNGCLALFFRNEKRKRKLSKNKRSWNNYRKRRKRNKRRNKRKLSEHQMQNSWFFEADEFLSFGFSLKSHCRHICRFVHFTVRRTKRSGRRRKKRKEWRTRKREWKRKRLVPCGTLQLGSTKAPQFPFDPSEFPEWRKTRCVLSIRQKTASWFACCFLKRSRKNARTLISWFLQIPTVWRLGHDRWNWSRIHVKKRLFQLAKQRQNRQKFKSFFKPRERQSTASPKVRK